MKPHSGKTEDLLLFLSCQLHVLESEQVLYIIIYSSNDFKVHKASRMHQHFLLVNIQFYYWFYCFVSNKKKKGPKPICGAARYFSAGGELFSASLFFHPVKSSYAV